MDRKSLFFLLLIFSSCSSIYRFSVDIQEPALVTLPVSAQNVLILNNTVAQPINFGIERTIDGQSIRQDYPLSLDSMAWAAIEEISVVLNESNFFKTISIYRQPIRTDNEWLSRVETISPEVQSDFYNTENYDALLVIDRILFSINENVKSIKTGYSSPEATAFVDLRADGAITCSMYVPGREKPLTTFNVSDSLFTKSVVENDSVALFTKIPEYILDELSRRIGNQMATSFIPTWKTSDRVLFTGYSSRMQEATGYAADRQWKKAESIWTAEIERVAKPGDKAKIAFNLAVINEMQDRVDSALAYAEKAGKYMESIDQNKNSQQIEITNQYISELKQRIQHNQLLDLQWGKE